MQTRVDQGCSGLWRDRTNRAGGRPPGSAGKTALVFAGNRQTTRLQNQTTVSDLNALTFAAGASDTLTSSGSHLVDAATVGDGGCFSPGWRIRT